MDEPPDSGAMSILDLTSYQHTALIGPSGPMGGNDLRYSPQHGEIIYTRLHGVWRTSLTSPEPMPLSAPTSSNVVQSDPEITNSGQTIFFYESGGGIMRTFAMHRDGSNRVEWPFSFGSIYAVSPDVAQVVRLGLDEADTTQTYAVLYIQDIQDASFATLRQLVPFISASAEKGHPVTTTNPTGPHSPSRWAPRPFTSEIPVNTYEYSARNVPRTDSEREETTEPRNPLRPYHARPR